jgi:hypothetical protein
MPKIKITTDRRPWVGGKPQANGATLDVDEATADTLAANGFAEKVRGAPKKKVGFDD